MFNTSSNKQEEDQELDKGWNMNRQISSMLLQPRSLLIFVVATILIFLAFPFSQQVMFCLFYVFVHVINLGLFKNWFLDLGLSWNVIFWLSLVDCEFWFWSCFRVVMLCWAWMLVILKFGLIVFVCELTWWHMWIWWCHW